MLGSTARCSAAASRGSAAAACVSNAPGTWPGAAPAADPLSAKQLRGLGAFWVDPDETGAAPPDVFVTRLHVRYDAEHFPDDLVFQQTGDRSNFQGRYILRHPWTGSDRCDAPTDYRRLLVERWPP